MPKPLIQWSWILSNVRSHKYELIVANLIAWPVGYFIMNRWLEGFAFRTSLSIWIFLTSGLAALTIAALTVSSQVIKAALANPVDSLKYE